MSASEAENHEFEFFCSLNRISVWAFHQMVPLALVVPSTLLAMMGLGSFSRGNLRRQRRPMSIKFLVAPQSTRAVVLTICVPLDSLMGMHKVLSFGRAVITWFTIWEEYIDSSSQAKKILKFYRCYIFWGVFVASFQDLEDFSFVLPLHLQGLNICFDGRDWGGSRIDAGLRHGVREFGSISGANVLRAGSGLVVLTGTVSWFSASEA